jgi:hypothetical protein
MSAITSRCLSVIGGQRLVITFTMVRGYGDVAECTIGRKVYFAA